MPRSLAALPLLFLASGCLVRVPVIDPVYSPCHAIGSSGWTARVERIPDHHNRPVLKPILIVTGDVVVPADGYDVSLELGPVETLDRKIQEVMVRTNPPSGAPGGTAATLAVEGRFPAPKHLGTVAIRCGDGRLATIEPSWPADAHPPRRAKRLRIF